jgi:hypothetical protein
LLTGGFHIQTSKTETVVFGWTYRFQQGDTLVLPYTKFGTKNINDTLRKYLGNNGSTIKSILIAQPSYVIDSIDFNLFPNLKELTLSGGDDDVLQYRKYNFMSVTSLKRINNNLVFVEYPSHDTDYTVDGKKRFRNFIHLYRPDIKVRWPRNYGYKIMWTDRDE